MARTGFDSRLFAVGLGFLIIVAGFFMYGGTAYASSCHVVTGPTSVWMAGDCPAGAQIATYQYRDGASPGDFLGSLPQTLFDSGTTALLPPCAWQADIYTGVAPRIIDGQHDFGGGFVAGAHGGTIPCRTGPVPLPTPFSFPPDSTTTTTTPTLTTVPPAVTSSVPPTNATVPSTTTELARTGVDPFWIWFGGGFVIGGLLFVWMSRQKTKR